MLVALPIEALLMGAKSGHPAFNLFANGAPGNGWLPRCRRDFNRRFELFKFDHGRRGGRNLRIGLRLLPADGLHKCHCLRD